MSLKILKPKSLKIGDTIGVFTPSSPAYLWNEGLFLNGLENLRRLGFKIKLGDLTARRASEGYRSGSAEDRAAEFGGADLEPYHFRRSAGDHRTTNTDEQLAMA